MSWFGIIVAWAGPVKENSQPTACSQQEAGKSQLIFEHMYTVFLFIRLFSYATSWLILKTVCGVLCCYPNFSDVETGLETQRSQWEVVRTPCSLFWLQVLHLTMALTVGLSHQKTPPPTCMGLVLRLLLKAGREQLQYALWSNRDSGASTIQNCDIYIWSISVFLSTNSPPVCFSLSFFNSISDTQIRG